MKIVTRQDAKRRRLKRFFTGKPCKHGHIAERVVSAGACVECSRAATRAWYRAESPGRYAAMTSRARANHIYPGSVPADFDFGSTLPFYIEAARLTHETGVKHEVDHIKALCLGGKHIASNLQVLTRAQNCAKAKAERRPNNNEKGKAEKRLKRSRRKE